MIVAALFPYISATDDILRIEHFTAQQTGAGHSNKEHQNENLLRLYETVDTPLLGVTCQIEFVLFFVAFLLPVVFRFLDRETPFYTGRSPPALP